MRSLLGVGSVRAQPTHRAPRRNTAPRPPHHRRSVLFLVLATRLIGGYIALAADVSGAGEAPARKLDVTYRPPPIWGCEEGLAPGAFHVVVATFAPEVRLSSPQTSPAISSERGYTTLPANLRVFGGMACRAH